MHSDTIWMAGEILQVGDFLVLMEFEMLKWLVVGKILGHDNVWWPINYLSYSASFSKLAE